MKKKICSVLPTYTGQGKHVLSKRRNMKLHMEEMGSRVRLALSGHMSDPTLPSLHLGLMVASSGLHLKCHH